MFSVYLSSFPVHCFHNQRQLNDMDIDINKRTVCIYTHIFTFVVCILYVTQMYVHGASIHHLIRVKQFLTMKVLTVSFTVIFAHKEKVILHEQEMWLQTCSNIQILFSGTAEKSKASALSAICSCSSDCKSFLCYQIISSHYWLLYPWWSTGIISDKGNLITSLTPSYKNDSWEWIVFSSEHTVQALIHCSSLRALRL